MQTPTPSHTHCGNVLSLPRHQPCVPTCSHTYPFIYVLPQPLSSLSHLSTCMLQTYRVTQRQRDAPAPNTRARMHMCPTASHSTQPLPLQAQRPRIHTLLPAYLPDSNGCPGIPRPLSTLPQGCGEGRRQGSMQGLPDPSSWEGNTSWSPEEWQAAISRGQGDQAGGAAS